MGLWKELFALGLLCMLGKCWGDGRECGLGFSLDPDESRCVDMDECEEKPGVCGSNSKCINSNGSFYCQCRRGFGNVQGPENFKANEGRCEDVDECTTYPEICRNGKCFNQVGSYNCTCNDGFIHTGDGQKNCTDINECSVAESRELCGAVGTCKNTDGGYWCMCKEGYSNYGNSRTKCSELDCDSFNAAKSPAPSLGGLADVLSLMKNSCLTLSNQSATTGAKDNGEALLEKLFTAIEDVLSTDGVDSTEDVSGVLGTVEKAVMLIAPQLKHNRTRLETTKTDAEIAVERGKTRPTGPIRLTTEDAAVLDTDWTTAAGTGSYPGFAFAALLSYKNLAPTFNESVKELTGLDRDGVEPTLQVNSRVVSVVVSNPSTQNLSSPVTVTFRHLQDRKKSPEAEHVCAYWNEEGTWSTLGCKRLKSNVTHTVCQSQHLSSFAVLMALYPMEHTFGLLLVTKIGLSISLLCLVLCILTFKFCRSIQGTRTTIHLHLCICLFMGDLFFLAGISQTKPEGGCRFVAAMLHFFFLGVFSWMLLEGVQLYRMVVLVFNTTIRPLYLFLVGYGAPLAIVIISAIIRPKGYGTNEHCWLSISDGLIWSFFGPVCLIIILNVVFFIVTVWKLAQKFTSLNPDMPKLHKIKAFTVTAVAQMCILGLMWVFGAFLFRKESLVEAYIFTLFNSLQGALLFVMHCLLSKQVRDEYAYFLSGRCTPQKKRLSEFSSTNPSSSQSQGSRSAQNTRESQI